MQEYNFYLRKIPSPSTAKGITQWKILGQICKLYKIKCKNIRILSFIKDKNHFFTATKKDFIRYIYLCIVNTKEVWVSG